MIDKRNNDDVIIADIVDDSVPNAEGFKPTLVFNSMHQSQQQNVAVIIRR